MVAKIDFDKLDKRFPNAYFDCASGCVEPGYDDKPVILADWNHVPAKIFDKLEELGYSCEWSDEWVTCDNCYKVFRSSPDCYHWQMSGIILDGYALCLECMNPEEYFESIENNPHKALTHTIHDRYNPLDYGYELVKGEFENGFHPGQDDNPEEILENAQKDNPGQYLFAMTDQGQFDIEFALYRKINQSTNEE